MLAPLPSIAHTQAFHSSSVGARVHVRVHFAGLRLCISVSFVYALATVQARSPKGNTAAAVAVAEMRLSEHELSVCWQAALEKTAALRSHQ